MKVAHFGTFDVDNYGDLLFPLVIEACLGEGIEWVHVSPVGGKTGFSDAVTAISVAEAAARIDSFDALIVGGGNLIHDGLSAVPRYVEDGQDISAYPALWILPALLAATRESRVPVCWNSPGVGEELRPETHPAVVWTVGQLAYASVRDQASADRLAAAGTGPQVEVGIDTALEMGRLWNPEERRKAHAETLAAGGFPADRKTVCFHLRSWYADGLDVSEIAAVITEIAELEGALPLLLCIGNCHGDAGFAHSVASQMSGEKLVVDSPPTLKHVFSAIACSRAYIGASLHGAITGYATGVKTLVVAPDGREKFDGFLGQVGGLHWRVGGWQDCVARARELFDAAPDLWEKCYEIQRPGLEAHWEKLGAALRGSSPKPAENILEILGKIPVSWCGLHAYLPGLSSKEGYPEIIREQARLGLRNARLEEQRLHAELAGCRQEIAVLKRKLRGSAGPAVKVLDDLNKIASSVDDLYKTGRWRLGNTLSGKWHSSRHSGLDRSLRKLREKLENRR